jgi:hypothetical protein
VLGEPPPPPPLGPLPGIPGVGLILLASIVYRSVGAKRAANIAARLPLIAPYNPRSPNVERIIPLTKVWVSVNSLMLLATMIAALHYAISYALTISPYRLPLPPIWHDLMLALPSQMLIAHPNKDNTADD